MRSLRCLFIFLGFVLSTGAQASNDLSGVSDKKYSLELSKELFEAVRVKSVEEVERLVVIPKVDVNYRSYSGETALMEISRSSYGSVENSFEIAKLLLSREEIAVNLQDNYGETALMGAVAYNNVGIAMALLNRPEIMVNLKSNSGITALHNAASTYKGNLKLLVTLLNRSEIHANELTKEGFTPLALSVIRNQKKEKISALVSSSKVDVNFQNKDGRTALMVGASKNSHVGLEAFLAASKESGVKVNLKDKDGNTALILAASNGADNSKSLSLLLEQEGIETNITNHKGESALSVSALYKVSGSDGMPPVTGEKNVEALLKNSSVNMNVSLKSGRSLFLEVSSLGYDKVVKEFIKAGVDVDQTTKDNSATPLILASGNGRLQTVKELLKVRVDVDYKNKNGQSALDFARNNLHEEVVKVLSTFSKNADVSKISKEDQLLIAFETDHFSVVKELLKDESLNVNVVDANGNTPLYNFVKSDNLEIASLILDHPRVTLGKTNDKELTAFYVAVKEGSLEMVQKFLEKKKDQIEFNVLLGKNKSLSVFQAAVRRNHLGVVKELLKIKDLDPNLGSPLIWAANRKEFFDIFKVLLADFRVDVNIENGAVQSGAADWGQASFVDELLKHEKIDVNAGGASGLRAAVEKGHKSIVDKYLDHPEIETTATNSMSYGNRSLILSSAMVPHWFHSDFYSKEDHIYIFKRLLDHESMDINAQSVDGQTALMAASARSFDSSKDPVAVELRSYFLETLLNREDVKVNLQNNNLETALIIAAKSENLSVVRALLSHEKIDPNIQDNTGKSAWAWVKYHGQTEVAAQIAAEILNHPKIQK